MRVLSTFQWIIFDAAGMGGFRVEVHDCPTLGAKSLLNARRRKTAGTLEGEGNNKLGGIVGSDISRNRPKIRPCFSPTDRRSDQEPGRPTEDPTVFLTDRPGATARNPADRPELGRPT
jgi:hypothetical protein